MTHTTYHDKNGNQIDEPVNNQYGKSAFIDGREVCSTYDWGEINANTT